MASEKEWGALDDDAVDGYKSIKTCDGGWRHDS